MRVVVLADGRASPGRQHPLAAKGRERGGVAHQYQRLASCVPVARDTVGQIRSLLWEHEYTIAGARQKLASGETKRDSEQSRQIVRQVRIELEEILGILRQ